MLRLSCDARIGDMPSRILQYMSPEVSQAVATRMRAHQNGQGNGIQWRALVTSIQKVGYIVQGPFWGSI